MRKLLAPVALILAGFIGLAGAQQITKSVQLSQDPTGLIGFDTFNSIYLPGPHLLLTYPVAPTIYTAGGTGQTCGTNGEVTAPTIAGNDTMGVITVGSGATTKCTLVWNKAWNTAPWCIVAPNNGLIAAFSWVANTNDLEITQTSTASDKINYFCTSLS